MNWNKVNVSKGVEVRGATVKDKAEKKIGISVFDAKLIDMLSGKKYDLLATGLYNQKTPEQPETQNANIVDKDDHLTSATKQLNS